MSRTAIDEFLVALRTEAKLERELVDLAGGNQRLLSADLLVELGARHGFEFALEDLRKHPNVRSRELSVDELENVAGGAGSRSYAAGHFVVEIDGSAAAHTFDMKKA